MPRPRNVSSIKRFLGMVNYFSQVKSDLRRHQKEVYDRKARFLAIPPGKIVYVRKEPQTHKPGMATRFLRSFDGPFQVIGHPYDRNDLLTFKFRVILFFWVVEICSRTSIPVKEMLV